MEYLDRGTNQMIHIEDDMLIKPCDIDKHIGELVSIHNGAGYVVTCLLTDAITNKDDKYSFMPPSIKYELELDMSMFYYPDRINSICDTTESAKMIDVNKITVDEIMYNIRYVAKLTDEELAFRKKMLSYSDAMPG